MATATLISAKGIAIGTSATTFYTVPTGVNFIAKRLTVMNTSGTAATVTIQTSTGSTTALATAVSVSPNTCITIPTLEGHVFSAGEVIQAIASAASSIYISRLSGVTST